MVELLIRNEDLARRVLEIAEREQRSVEAVLDAVLTAYENVPHKNPLLQMAAAADALGATADCDDISEHFDEVLREMWGKAGDTQQSDDEPNLNVS